MKILVVEDNYNLAHNITEFLESRGYLIDYAADGITAFNLVLTQTYDVILLDIMMPGMSGFRVCEKLRDKSGISTPIIMLTAKDTEEDKLKGFRLGADDYLVKPFSLPELEARIVALNRRTKQALTGATNLVVADLVYNPDTMSFKRGDVKLRLKPVPRKILVLLMKNANRVVSRQEIEREIWNDDPPDSEVLRSHIYAIRCEVDKQSSVNLLHTIRGAGYLVGDTESEL
jgi:DNA-binding response OmpR family regulator